MSLDLSAKRILVIDDFAQMRSSLKRMMQAFGATDVDEAANGDDAVKRMARRRYDVVLCDYALGEGKDGQQVLEEGRHRDLLKCSAVFVMITAETGSGMVMGAVEYRPDAYLTKPFTKELLARRLERLIERKRDFGDIESALHGRHYDRAIALCDDHIGRRPNNLLEFFRLKGELCLKAGSYDQAEAVYEKVLALRPVPWAVMGMAKVCFHRREYDKAGEILADLLNANDSHVEAYDVLAKCRQKLGEHREAQACLARAAKLSPNSVHRQRALGGAARRNRDLDTAEKSFSKVIRLARHSIYKSPRDYANLIRVLLDRDSPTQALKVLHKLRKEYRNDTAAEALGHAVEGLIYKKLNRAEEAGHALAAAASAYEGTPGNPPLELAMDLASARLALGDREKANAMITDIVRDCHDDEDVLEQVKTVFEGAGLEEEGKRIIASTREEVAGINEKGASLVREKKFREAIDFFDRAADGLPGNKMINMNAAQAIIMLLEENGKDDKLLCRARRYLDRVQRLAPANAEYGRLAKRYRSLVVAK